MTQSAAPNAYAKPFVAQCNPAGASRLPERQRNSASTTPASVVASTADTVTAVYTLLGLPAPTAEQAASIAASADYVRAAILTGHG